MNITDLPLNAAGLLHAPLMLETRYVQSCIATSSNARELSQMLFPMRDRDVERQLEGGVAIIPVRGTLYHRGWNSYETIERDFRAALDNTNVKGIVFDIDSPGGMVAGCFDLTDLIYQSRGEKPTLAVVNQRACSAAYAIASACDAVSISKTADAGSVGVVMTHWDVSGAMERWGETITLIYAGAHKVDGNPFQPLPDSVRSRFQAEIQDCYGMFVATVARNRGMTPEAVQATEALVFTGQAAIDVGFADSMNSASDAITDFIARANDSATGAITMKIKSADLKKKLAAQGLSEDAIKALGLPANDDEEVEVEPDVSAETPETPAPTAEQPAADSDEEEEEEEEPAAAAKDDKARIKTILSSEAAKDRQELASYFALETDLPAEAAIAALEKAAKQPADPLAAAMSQQGGAGIDGDDEVTDSERKQISTSWDAAIQKTGGKLKKSA